jgi:hypothetical protein
MTRKVQLLCLFTTLCLGLASAASLVTYVYVQECSSRTGDIAPSPSVVLRSVGREVDSDQRLTLHSDYGRSF